MNTIIFGASGGTGAAVARKLITSGETVTAFQRQASGLAAQRGATVFCGDAMRAADVAAAMPGHDRVVITLGNSQNPFGLLFGGKRTTPRDICETGTRNILAAMQVSGISRVICVTAFGIGATKAQSPLMFKIFYSLILREHMADKEKQESLLRASNLDWTLIQPVGLIDQPVSGTYLASPEGALRKQTISRTDLAAAIADALDDYSTIHKSIALSG